MERARPLGLALLRVTEPHELFFVALGEAPHLVERLLRGDQRRSQARSASWRATPSSVTTSRGTLIKRVESAPARAEPSLAGSHALAVHHELELAIVERLLPLHDGQLELHEIVVLGGRRPQLE